MKDFCGICGLPVNGGLTNHPECEEQAFWDAHAKYVDKALEPQEVARRIYEIEDIS